MKWDQWVGHSNKGPVVMRIKTLFTFRGWAVQLHQIVHYDRQQCYHTHPARAFRLILWNGYEEEVYEACRWWRCAQAERCFLKPDAQACHISRLANCRPGFFGWVEPEFTHRINKVFGKVSYSLWVRGPVTHEIQLVGEGWHKESA